MKRFLVLAGLVVLAIALGLWRGWSPRTDLEAALLLADWKAENTPSLLKELAPRPQRQTMSWDIAGRRGSGDLYLPGDKARAALILIPDSTSPGRESSRLVALAQSLARTRFLVLVPDLTSATASRTPQAVQQGLRDAIQWLSEERKPPLLLIAAHDDTTWPVLDVAAQDRRITAVIGWNGDYPVVERPDQAAKLASLAGRLFLVHTEDAPTASWALGTALAQHIPDTQMAILHHLPRSVWSPSDWLGTIRLWHLVRTILLRTEPAADKTEAAGGKG